jgi:tetratricopeptide (TPR) repeat protein
MFKSFLSFFKKLQTKPKEIRYATHTETWTSILLEEKPRILERLERILALGDRERAKKTLEGFLGRHPYAQDIHNLLGNLYFEDGDLVRAGRHWYFKEVKDEKENSAVAHFESSFGSDPLHILKHLIYKENYRLTMLDGYTIICLERLLNEIILKHNVVPKFARHISTFIHSQKK